jgi:hypothetical protein
MRWPVLLATLPLIATTLVGLSATAASATTQTWQWVHQLGSSGYDQAYGIMADAAGNTYITGYTYGTLSGSPEVNAGNADVFVAKYDATGNRVWLHQLGTSGYDIGSGVAVDAAGNSYVTGYTSATLPGSADPTAGTNDAFVAKYDASGSLAWVHQLGSADDDEGVGIAANAAGDTFVTGYTSGKLAGSAVGNAGSTDVFVAKYDTAGNRMWVDQLGSIAVDIGVGIAADASGDTSVTGYTYGALPGAPEANAGGSDVFVARYDAAGTKLSVDQLGSAGSDYGSDLAVDAAGNTYVTGHTSGTLPGSAETNAGGNDALVAKYDTTGARQWVHQLGTAFSDQGAGIAVDGAGNSFVTGYTSGTLPGSANPNAGGTDVFVANYDAAGNKVAVNQLGSPSSDEGTGAAVDATGLIYVTGYTYGTLPGATETNAGSSDIFVTRLGPSIPLAPAAPTAVSAASAPESASVSWTAAADNGSAITGYTVTASPGGESSTVAGTQTTATVTGLTNGTSYTFTVTATNAIGTSVPSAASNPVVPAAVPDAPTGVAASARPDSAFVTWVAPAGNGGTITSYTVTAAPGGASATVDGTQTTATVTGLSSGTAYTFSVTATSGSGTGAASSPSNAITPLPPAAPDAPAGVEAVAGNQQASVSWTPPGDNGSAIASYTVTASPAGASTTVAGSQTTATVTALTNGTSYTFTVVATNAIGASAPSTASNAVTPSISAAPDAPTGVVAAAGAGLASVSWTAPSDNGNAITAYTVTASPGGASTSTDGTHTSATVAGLTDGTSYTFTVTATNAVGTSAPSTASNAVVPLDVPGAPMNVSATAGAASAAVSWAAPVSNGSAIVDYTVTASPGGIAVTVPYTQTAASVTGLTDGASYTFTVVARNAVGTSVPSLPSNAVVPAGVPGAPTSVVAVAGAGSASVTWSAPANNGNPITSYTVTAAPGGAATTVFAQTSATVTGLLGGIAYTFTVTATNAIGTGPPSTASNSVIPPDVPGAPTNVTAIAGAQSAAVTWSAPANGNPITSYAVTASPGGAPSTIDGTQTSATVTGLANGTSYTFTVTATNAVGTSAASAPSNAVTPLAVPDAPTGARAVAGNQQASVAWTAPSGNGSPIASYTVTAAPGGWSTSVDSSQTAAIVAGLTNGTSYTFTVTATNGVGSSPPSAASNAIVPAAVPGAPTGVSAAAGNQQATVMWAAPLASGDPITGYTVTAVPGGKWVQVSGAQTTATLTGLTNGISYTFTVQATNSSGTGAASAPSLPVVPFGIPAAPTSAHATSSGAELVASWTAAAANGSTITGYTVVVSPGGRTATTAGTQTHTTIAGLAAGTYTFAVRATNAAGTGASSSSNPATIVVTQSIARTGYWMLAANGAVYGFGDAAKMGDAAGPTVAIAPRLDGKGYWTVDAAGNVSHFGAATDHGGRPARQPAETVSTISATPSGNGYWLFTNRGRAFPYGDAHFYGDMTGTTLNGPIIASVATPTGHGYYMVGSDGGVFNFGDAGFHGSTGNLHLNRPVVGISPSPDNRGYWLVASDGGVFAFTAPFRGSMGSAHLNKPVNGLVAFGSGYLMVASDGGIFDFSDKPFLGSLANNPPPAPIIGVAAFTGR